jgi:hypothetical protein
MSETGRGDEYLADMLIGMGYRTFYIIHDTSSYGVDCRDFMKIAVEKGEEPWSPSTG